MGFDVDGERLEEQPQHEPELVVQHLGGRAKMYWDPPAPLPMHLARAQLAYMKDVVARYEAEINSVGAAE